MPEEKDINDYSDLLEGGDEKVVEADDKVSPAGEIIPENMKPVETEIVEPVKVEEPPKEVIPETTETQPENPYDTRFKELGLEKQFKGGVEEMLSNQRATNQYITQKEAEVNQLRADLANRTQPEAKPEATPTGDDLYNDPLTVVNKIVDSRITDVNAQLESMRAEQFAHSKDDFKQLEPIMMAKAKQFPGLAKMGSEAVQILYEMAKAEQLSEAKAAPPTPPPVTEEQKANAAMTTGKKEVTPDKDSMAHWEGKSLKEMEAEIGVIPEQ